MKTIHRYIFREMFKIFSISTIFLTFILLMEQMLFMSVMIADRGFSFMEGMKMMLYTCPVFLILSIPLSVLVASLTTFNQFSVDNEYTAMRTSGWSFLFLMRPVIYFSILAYIATNIIVFYGIPWGTDSFRKTIFNIIQNRAHINIKPNVFNNDFKGLVLYAKGKEGDTQLKELFVADESGDGPSKIILAKKGVIMSDPETLKIKLQFQNGTIHDVKKEGKAYNIVSFERYERSLDLPNADKLLSKITVRHRDTSYRELKEKIRKEKALGLNTNHHEVRLGRKFSIPFSCLLFGLAGATLGIKSSRSGKSGGIILCGFVVALYYIFLICSQRLGKIGVLNPVFSPWIPNILLMLFTVYMVWKITKERPHTFSNKLMDVGLSGFEMLRNAFKLLYKKFNFWESTRNTNTPLASDTMEKGQRLE